MPRGAWHPESMKMEQDWGQIVRACCSNQKAPKGRNNLAWGEAPGKDKTNLPSPEGAKSPNDLALSALNPIEYLFPRALPWAILFCPFRAKIISATGPKDLTPTVGLHSKFYFVYNGFENTVREGEKMGKGDLKTRRGKIHRGTSGKTRPRKRAKKAKKAAAVAPATPAALTTPPAPQTDS